MPQEQWIPLTVVIVVGYIGWLLTAIALYRSRSKNDTQIAGRVAKKVLAVSSRKGVIDELSKGSVSDQTNKLNELVGTGALPGGRLKRAIMKKSPKEMDKAIKKFQKKGKEITVDSLLAEVRSDKGFLKMCEGVGLDYGWFEKLAKERMEVKGL